MTLLTRRTLVKGSTALAATGALAGSGLTEWAKAWAQTAPWKPEKGAQLSMLRWKYFVQSEDESFVALLDAFTKATGVKVSVTRESYEDIPPKASSGRKLPTPDRTCSGSVLAAPPVPRNASTDAAWPPYLGKKYGGWVPTAETYGKSGNKWIDIPVCFGGNMLNYRIEASKKAGFSKFPETNDAFLEYTKAMKANNTTGGFALGHASGDGNAWVHWCLWSNGGNVVDKNDKVILNSPETVKALEYAKQLYDNMIPGVAAWNDAFNNKAFLAGEISWTNNGISIYAAAKKDPTKKEIAEDMDHALWPVGPIGRPTEFHVCYPILAMTIRNIRSPALMAFLPRPTITTPGWRLRRHLTHPLNAYTESGLDVRSQNTIFGEARTVDCGRPRLDRREGGGGARDFIVRHVANVCGRETPKGDQDRRAVQRLTADRGTVIG
jgi:multiple sugar transport system substrate-binding protein